MKDDQKQEVLHCEENLLSEVERFSMRAIQAPARLGERIQQRLLDMRPAAAVQRAGLRQLTAAGLLGFLSFFGAEVLVSQLSPVSSQMGVSLANPSNGSESTSSGTTYHLTGLAALSDADYYLDTLAPLSSPEVALAAFLHDREKNDE